MVAGWWLVIASFGGGGWTGSVRQLQCDERIGCLADDRKESSVCFDVSR